MTHSRHLTLTDLAATSALGHRLAALLDAGDVVCLAGDLGAGKTAAAIPLWHVDLYRIEDPADVEQLGLDDAFDDAITLIEWPERLANNLPADRLEISIAITGAGVDTVREARITGFGSWESRVDEF